MVLASSSFTCHSGTSLFECIALKQSIKATFRATFIHSFDVWKSSMQDAYLQCETPLGNAVTILESPLEIYISTDQSLQLLKLFTSRVNQETNGTVHWMDIIATE